MKTYNAERINEFVDLIGMQYEFKRLKEFGLDYAQFADVLDSILNPSSETKFGSLVIESFGMGQKVLKNSLEKAIEECELTEKGLDCVDKAVEEYTMRDITKPERNYSLFSLYFGLRTPDKITQQSIADFFGVSRSLVHNKINYFKKLFGRYGYRENRQGELVPRSFRIQLLKKEIWDRGMEKILAEPEDLSTTS